MTKKVKRTSKVNLLNFLHPKNSSLFKISLLLILVTLIKIGQLPLLLAKLILFLIRKISRLRLPIISLPQVKLPQVNLTKPKLPTFFYHLPSPYRVGVVIGVVVIILSLYTAGLLYVFQVLPSPSSLDDNTHPLTTQIYDRNGKLLYQIYEGQNRKLVKLSQLPSYLIDSTLAIEDKNFYRHPGIDLLAIIRATKANLAGQGTQGGSTITQQLVKSSLLTPEKSIPRKIKELILAFWAERIYSKDQILEMYFNQIPYGGPAWGVEAASEMYFGKGARDLTLAESSFLAGLTAAPTQFSPFGTYPERGKKRQLEVLRRLVEDNKITRAQADQAFSDQLKFVPQIQNIKAPHFVMYVRSLLAQKYGEKTVSQGGLKVITSLDLDIQEMAQQVVAQQINSISYLNVSNGAAMVTDPKTGQILAMVGSKNYFEGTWGNYNVTLAPRQPGSSIKPITYTTAFKQGFSPGSMLLDGPTTFKNAWESYSPVNYDGKYHGPVTIRTALGSSYNIPAVKMLATVGIPAMLETAKDMGITTFEDSSRFGLSLTLGGGEVRMIDMMSVYGTLAHGGVKKTLNPILKITDVNGQILEDWQDKLSEKQVISPEVAYLISHILADNSARTPAFGPNSALVIPYRSVAVKTGTTDSKRDNWTFGYTPQLVVGVWVGNNDNSPMNPQLTSGVTGAAPIWHQIMVNLVQDRPDLAFTRPAGIVDGNVEGRLDLMMAGTSPRSTVFLKREKKDNKDQVTYTDPYSSYIPPQDTPLPVNR